MLSDLSPHTTTSSAYHLVYHYVVFLTTVLHSPMTHFRVSNHHLYCSENPPDHLRCSCFASFFLVRCISYCTLTYARHKYPKPRRYGRFKTAIYGRLRTNRVPVRLRNVAFRISKRRRDQTLSPPTITECTADKESTLGSTLAGGNCPSWISPS